METHQADPAYSEGTAENNYEVISPAAAEV